MFSEKGEKGFLGILQGGGACSSFKWSYLAIPPFPHFLWKTYYAMVFKLNLELQQQKLFLNFTMLAFYIAIINIEQASSR